MTVEHPKQTYYPEYNVMDQFHEWDKVTQCVIQKRLAASEVSFFKPEEHELMIALYPIITPSHLGDIGVNVVSLLDERCREGKMNGYIRGSKLRVIDVIRIGLRYVHVECYSQFHHTFSTLEKKLQISYVQQLQDNIGMSDVWIKIQPQIFLHTFSNELIKVVYSDPSIWSDLGFGGPAYPRGYYAFGFKQFDSWEAPLYDKDEKS